MTFTASAIRSNLDDSPSIDGEVDHPEQAPSRGDDDSDGSVDEDRSS
jgi:hypothetical protein